METAKDIQEFVFNKTQLKTGVRKGTGSMKGYLIIYPIYQNGSYPNIPIEICRELKAILNKYDYLNKPLFCTTSDISVYGLGKDREIYKKENKPKPINEKEIQKGWGSKNSQMRLDKAAARYAKKASRPGYNGPRYY